MAGLTLQEGAEELLRLRGLLIVVLAEATTQSGRILQREVVGQMQNLGLKASGDLIKSVKFKSATASLISNGIFDGGVYSDDDTEKVDTIEFGRKPGSKAPPMFRILQWMTLKGIVPDQSGAYLIARSIAVKGIPAKHPFEKGSKLAEPQIKAEFDNAIDAAFNQSNNRVRSKLH